MTPDQIAGGDAFEPCGLPEGERRSAFMLGRSRMPYSAEYKSRFESVNQLRKAGDADGAIRVLRALIADFPKQAALLTLGEVLVSATGLEFAYSQAPQAMKGALMAFWNLSVTIGNLWVLVVNAGVKNDVVTNFIASTGFGLTAFQMFFFAAFAFAAALGFGFVASTYPVADHYRKG